MQIALTITASPAVIAQILANLPSEAVASPLPVAPVAGPVVGLVGSPVIPSLAPAAAPTVGDDDDDTGPAAAGTPDVDADGLPWDARIHSAGTNRLNTDGRWRKKRGADHQTITAVEAELRARNAAPAPIVPPAQSIPVPIGVPMQPTVPLAAAPTPAPAPIPMAMPAPIPQPTAAPTAAQLQEQVDAVTAAAPAHLPSVPAQHVSGSIPTLADFMMKLTPMFSMHDDAGAPLVHADYLSQVTNETSNAFMAAGIIQQPLNSLPDIGDNIGMIDYVVQIMIRDGKWRV